MTYLQCAFSVTMAFLVVVICQSNKSSPVPPSGGAGAGPQGKAPPKEASKPGVSNSKFILDKNSIKRSKGTWRGRHEVPLNVCL